MTDHAMTAEVYIHARRRDFYGRIDEPGTAPLRANPHAIVLEQSSTPAGTVPGHVVGGHIDRLRGISTVVTR